MRKLALHITTFFLAGAAIAGPPEILDVKTSRAGMGWRFDVTLAHPDTGWDHYADGWEIIDEKGNQLGYRELMHPHVEEQPFTRSLRNVMLPDGVKRVWVRAKCSKDGWASDAFEVNLSP